MSRGDETMELTFQALLHDGPRAWKLRAGDAGDPKAREVWLPKSQCELVRMNKRDGSVMIEVPQWLAEKEGLA